MKDVCKKIWRFADCVEYAPPASPFDLPNPGELRFPIGVARLTVMKMLRALTLVFLSFLGSGSQIESMLRS